MSLVNKSCGACKFAVNVDSGYSNWTVMETFLHCMKKSNPDLIGGKEIVDFGRPEDIAEYNRILAFADNCPSHVEGAPVSIDVDEEMVPLNINDLDFPKDYSAYADTEEEKNLLNQYMNSL